MSTGSDLLDLAELAGGHGRGRGYALVYVTYLDDSDAEMSPVQTLAGYVARLEAWREFEVLAEAICTDQGVKILHAKDFQDTKGYFKGWSSIRKTTFIDGLYDAAVGRVDFGVSRSILKAEYRRRQRETGLNKSTSAYGTAFASLMFTTICDTNLAPQIVKEGMSFIVERGHNNNDEIEKHFHRTKDHPLFGGAVRTLAFARKEDSRAIQLADFFAFYSRRITAKFEKGGRQPLRPEPHYRRFRERLPHFLNTIYDPYPLGGEVADYSRFVPKAAEG